MTALDGYDRKVAENYDASRSFKTKWSNELAAVDRFVTQGPVLDVPFGTGRFVPIYRSKGLQFVGIDRSADMLTVALRKFPDSDVRVGSIFDLAFVLDTFETAVCVRLLEWLPLSDAEVVIERLRKIASTIVLTINHGAEGHREVYIYDFAKFLGVIDGLLIDDRQVTGIVPGIVSEMFKLRPACFDDVLAQFRHDYADRAGANVQRVADKFAGFFGLPPVRISADSVNVKAEYWKGAKIAECVQALAAHRFVTAEPPRRLGGVLTVIERDGAALMVDGRKRANRLMHHKGPHPVLVVRPR